MKAVGGQLITTSWAVPARGVFSYQIVLGFIHGKSLSPSSMFFSKKVENNQTYESGAQQAKWRNK